MKDLLQPIQPGKTTVWALDDFQQWMAIIIVTLLHAVHVYRYYVAIIIIIDFAAYILLLILCISTILL